MKLRGLAELELPTVEAEATEDFVKRGDRPHFIRATLEKRDGKWLARPLPNQGSQVISSIANADCLVEVAETGTLPRGMAVKVLLIR
ncbi:MAG: hypothetical protein ABSA97_02890 [Verrucomicrobiia bacterium]